MQEAFSKYLQMCITSPYQWSSLRCLMLLTALLFEVLIPASLLHSLVSLLLSSLSRCVSLSLSLCLSRCVSLAVSLAVSLSLCLAVCLSLSLRLCVSLCLSLSVSRCLSLRLSQRPKGRGWSRGSSRFLSYSACFLGRPCRPCWTCLSTDRKGETPVVLSFPFGGSFSLHLLNIKTTHILFKAQNVFSGELRRSGCLYLLLE